MSVQLFATLQTEPARLLCLWNFPGKNTGGDCHSLLQGIFLTQGLNLGLLNCRRIFTAEPPGKPAESGETGKFSPCKPEGAGSSTLLARGSILLVYGTEAMIKKEGQGHSASPAAQKVKNLPSMQETWIQSLGQEDSLEEGWRPTPVFLPGEFHGQRRLVGYSSWNHKKLDMTEQLTHTRNLLVSKLWCETLSFKV